MRRIALLIAVLLMVPVLTGADVSQAAMRARITVTNTGTSALTSAAVPIPLSTQGSLDAGYLATDTLNSQVCADMACASEVIFMPGPVNTALVQCSVYDQTSGTYTDYGTDCNDADLDDVPFTINQAGDALYLGAHQPFGAVRVQVSPGKQGIGTWTITWEYCSLNSDPATTCDTWSAIPDVADGTESFQQSGILTVSWDPLAITMRESTEGFDRAYWVRARVSSYTATTRSPTLTQVWYDIGLWWIWIASLDAGVSTDMYLYTGGPAIRTFQHYIPGPAGIVTADSSALEPGSQDVDIEVRGYFIETASSVTRPIMRKNTSNQYIQFHATTDRRVDVHIEYGTNDCDLTTTNVTSEVHTLRLETRPGAGTCRLLVDGVQVASDSITTAWQDNTDSWTWAAAGSTSGLGPSMAYVEYIRYSIGGTLALHYELNSTYTVTAIPDRAGTPQDGTPSFPAAPASVSTVVHPWEAISGAISTTGAATGIAVSDIEGAVEGTGFADTAPVDTDMPWYAFFSDLATTQSLPVRWFYTLVCGMSVVTGMVVAMIVTRSLFISAIVGGLILAMFVRPANVIEPWALLLYALLAAPAVWVLHRIGIGV